MEKPVRSPAAVAVARALCTAALDCSIEQLTTAARGHGYALAVHGSLARDVDLVAVPWIESADEAERLVETLRGVLAGIFGRCLTRGWSDKPHGRRACTLLVWAEGEHIDFDVSVLPRHASKWS